MAPRAVENSQSGIRDFESAVGYIHSLDLLDTPQHTHAYAFQHGIARARRLLERLGDAPKATTQCVLVAGSKGKGSTATMLSAVLSAAGYRVGIFTGPHLHTPLERFAIGRSGRHELMSEAQFMDWAARIERIVASWDRPELGQPTRFEAFTAMAYRWFEEQAVDLAVMEIGIGGRHDAVNLAEPMVSVITNISLEHTQMLGRTLPEIAYAKAGILRAHGEGVIAPQQDVVKQVILAEAQRLGNAGKLRFVEECCTLECAGFQIGVDAGQSGQWFHVHLHGSCAGAYSEELNGRGPLFCPLLGRYQLENAATAITAVQALRACGYDVRDDDVRQGFANLRWPGRFEVLRHSPLIIADGAHTPYSMAQLCASLQEYFPGRRLHFVLGILRDKDARGIIHEAARAAASLTFTDMDVRRAVPAEQLLATWQALDLSTSRPQGDPQNQRLSPVASTAVDISSAVRQALSYAGCNDVVCVAGSLHLAALAAEQIGNL
ncbi:MAG: hypothetical protein K6U78_08890 [Anaerolineae bacterium]|nr:hypothetical protein [Anaerolineae bacterium]